MSPWETGAFGKTMHGMTIAIHGPTPLSGFGYSGFIIVTEMNYGWT